MGSLGLTILLLMITTGPSAAETRGFFKTSDGVTLSYLAAGQAKPSEFAVVLIPGWCMPAVIWNQQLSYLGRRFPTFALDPRGQGDSEIATSGYTRERRATDIKEFINRFPKVLLVGWSLGAIESLQYVHMFGIGRLGGMALVDSSVGEGPAPRTSGDFKRRLRADRARTARLRSMSSCALFSPSRGARASSSNWRMLQGAWVLKTVWRCWTTPCRGAIGAASPVLSANLCCMR
jgi:pimeloyl-ACP methyl ester carboxylesterase